MFNIINTIILILINIINKFEKKILLLLKKTMLFVKFEKKKHHTQATWIQLELQTQVNCWV
jgi:hypothetical protein